MYSRFQYMFIIIYLILAYYQFILKGYRFNIVRHIRRSSNALSTLVVRYEYTVWAILKIHPNL